MTSPKFHSAFVDGLRHPMVTAAALATWTQTGTRAELSRGRVPFVIITERPVFGLA
jgi:hypothetical protein